MKYSLVSIAIFLVLITLVQGSTSATFSEQDAKYYSNFAKYANCAEKPLAKTCPQCLKSSDGYKFFFYFQTTRLKKFNYKLLIHYNDQSKKVVFSFAGPSVEHHNYVKFIYAKGFSLVKMYRVNVEREFALVYFKKLKPVIVKKLQNINKSGRGKYDIVFAGYSIGGSLATLAAFDLSKQKKVTNPRVYTYGSLRIGDAAFVALVNTSIRVWRIVKSSDYIVRIPTCYYSPAFKVWRCFSQPIIKKFIVSRTFPLRLYVRNYITYYRANNPVLRKVLSVDSKNKNTAKQVRKITKNPKRKITKKPAKKMTKKPTRKVNKTPARKIEKPVKKIVKKPTRKITKKPVKPTIKSFNRVNKRNSVFNRRKNIPTRIIRRRKSSPKKVTENAKRLYRKINSQKSKAKKEKSKKSKKESPSKNEKKSEKKPVKNEKPENKDKIIEGKIAPGKFTPVDYKSPIKKSVQKSNSSSTSMITFKPYIPTIKSITSVQKLSLEEIYFNFIYYTQPIGYEIFYDNDMTTYKTCQYSDGISICEKFVSLPTSFTIESHRMYYGVNFDQCSHK